MIAPARATPATICFTSFSLAYLPRARVLAQSLRAAHPHWELWALLVDVPPAGWDASGLACFDRVTRADALDIPDFAAWMFRHDVIEGCTAMKAVMLRALLGGGRDAGQHAGGAERVVYLDPDIAVFHPLCGIEQRLDTASIVLTPHQIAPDSETRAILDNELTSLRYGTYNLGFLAVRNDTSGRAFAAWWTERTRAACYDDVAAGLFTDQRYCDLVPALFTGVHIERDPGCNVASWNLGQRPVRFGAGGELMAGGELLKFYHFSKIGGVGEVMTDRYAGVGTEAHELVRWYRRAVQRAGGAAAPAWHYGRFEDGRAIPRAARLLWRARPELAAEFADPFRSGPGSFQDWLDRDDPAIVLANPEDGA